MKFAAIALVASAAALTLHQVETAPEPIDFDDEMLMLDAEADTKKGLGKAFKVIGKNGKMIFKGLVTGYW